MHEMTDAQLSERVCKALGIEPKMEHDFSDCDLETYDYGNPWRIGKPKCTCTPTAVYPEILDWPGFGRVVDRLRDKEIRWDHMALTNGTWGMSLFDPQKNAWSKCAYADTLPRALALAVLEWEASRRGVE